MTHLNPDNFRLGYVFNGVQIKIGAGYGNDNSNFGPWTLESFEVKLNLEQKPENSLREVMLGLEKEISEKLRIKPVSSNLHVEGVPNNYDRYACYYATKYESLKRLHRDVLPIFLDFAHKLAGMDISGA